MKRRGADGIWVIVNVLNIHAPTPASQKSCAGEARSVHHSQVDLLMHMGVRDQAAIEIMLGMLICTY